MIRDKPLSFYLFLGRDVRYKIPTGKESQFSVKQRSLSVSSILQIFYNEHSLRGLTTFRQYVDEGSDNVWREERKRGGRES